ncbi:MAG: hypothetical protein GAK43_02212 [Stenotrophomonas maltophilia]|nr:MAG: hypothetical protein GAK43_02212 [Stenotrophomonas maltophilia]
MLRLSRLSCLLGTCLLLLLGNAQAGQHETLDGIGVTFRGEPHALDEQSGLHGWEAGASDGSLQRFGEVPLSFGVRLLLQRAPELMMRQLAGHIEDNVLNQLHASGGEYEVTAQAGDLSGYPSLFFEASPAENASQARYFAGHLFAVDGHLYAALQGDHQAIDPQAVFFTSLELPAARIPGDPEAQLADLAHLVIYALLAALVILVVGLVLVVRRLKRRRAATAR